MGRPASQAGRMNFIVRPVELTSSMRMESEYLRAIHRSRSVDVVSKLAPRKHALNLASVLSSWLAIGTFQADARVQDWIEPFGVATYARKFVVRCVEAYRLLKLKFACFKFRAIDIEADHSHSKIWSALVRWNESPAFWDNRMKRDASAKILIYRFWTVIQISSGFGIVQDSSLAQQGFLLIEWRILHRHPLI